MSKTISSPVAAYPGVVLLADPLTFVQCAAWDKAISHTLKPEHQGAYLSQVIELWPGIIACVEKWELANFPQYPTPENLPAGTRKERIGVANLVSWLVREITAIYMADGEDPNE